jgi:hypothetical protein
MPLRDLPARRFPLRFEKYSKLYDELNIAATRFANLGYDDLAAEMEAVRDRLHRAWNAIMDAERSGR